MNAITLPPARSLSPGRAPARARDLLLAAPSVTPQVTNAEVSRHFHEHAEVVGLAVVEDGLPIGLINRNVFMEGFARPFARDVFGRKSCIAYMDKAPLIVDADTPVDELSALAIATGDKVLKDGYLITEGGRYAGIGTGFDLMRTLAELQAQKNRIVMESIGYASVIQRSFMRRSQEDLQASLAEHFLWWAPRDVVGGDCYYFRRFDRGLFFAIIDCTGHGVPGAFMTLIVMSALDRMLAEASPEDPAALLAGVNRRIKEMLGQDRAADAPGSDLSASDDGFDGGFAWYEPERRRLVYAGAKTALLLLKEGAAGVETVDGDRKGVGYAATPMDHLWRNAVCELAAGTRVFLSSDGLVDQIGGPRNIAFGKRRLREIIREAADRPMAAHGPLLQARLAEYQGDHHRRDDVTVFGFQVD